jgi:hypothetical protein
MKSLPISHPMTRTPCPNCVDPAECAERHACRRYHSSVRGALDTLRGWFLTGVLMLVILGIAAHIFD